MIKNISIKDFALIKELQVDFSKGLNVITGETGAGKSIFISAINFVLGGRVDKSNIRFGCDFAKIEAVFDITHNELAKQVLDEFGFENDNVLIINRKISQDGKNEIRINGNFVTLAMLKKVTTNLVDIYGQHEHQTLLNKEKHIDYIDSYLGESVIKAKQNLSELLSQKRMVEEKISRLGGDELSREREKDILTFQVEELEKANLKAGEEEQLTDKKKKMDNFQRVCDVVKICREALTEATTNSVVENCYTSKKLLGGIISIDSEFGDIADRLDSVEIEVRDIADSLEEKLSEFDFNEFEFQKIDERLDLIKSFKRKYGATIIEMLEFLEQSKNRLLELEDTEELLAKYQNELNALNINIDNLCKALTELRQQGFSDFAQKVLSELRQLGMKNCRFEAQFTPKTPQSNGADDVEFMFSANLGEPLKPLIKVISGGEMSRFMLAFKVVMGNLQAIDTMIFDEIDSGISGVVSVEVGQKMARLARTAQILTITHLATIASFADTHFLIAKNVQDGATFSKLTVLDTNGQLAEIARLAGGDSQSKVGIEHANELKTQAKNFISSIK